MWRNGYDNLRLMTAKGRKDVPDTPKVSDNQNED
jgi:hypothetical protein